MTVRREKWRNWQVGLSFPMAISPDPLRAPHDGSDSSVSMPGPYPEKCPHSPTAGTRAPEVPWFHGRSWAALVPERKQDLNYGEAHSHTMPPTKTTGPQTKYYATTAMKMPWCHQLPALPRSRQRTREH
jgi:hypothetical protein